MTSDMVKIRGKGMRGLGTDLVTAGDTEAE